MKLETINLVLKIHVTMVIRSLIIRSENFYLKIGCVLIFVLNKMKFVVFCGQHCGTTDRNDVFHAERREKLETVYQDRNYLCIFTTNRYRASDGELNKTSMLNPLLLFDNAFLQIGKSLMHKDFCNNSKSSTGSSPVL